MQPVILYMENLVRNASLTIEMQLTGFGITEYTKVMVIGGITDTSSGKLFVLFNNEHTYCSYIL